MPKSRQFTSGQRLRRGVPVLRSPAAVLVILACVVHPIGSLATDELTPYRNEAAERDGSMKSQAPRRALLQVDILNLEPWALSIPVQRNLHCERRNIACLCFYLLFVAPVNSVRLVRVKLLPHVELLGATEASTTKQDFLALREFSSRNQCPHRRVRRWIVRRWIRPRPRG